MPLSKVQYHNLPGPVGECLKPASLATTATVPLSSTSILIYTTGHIGLDLKTGALVNATIEAELNGIFNCLEAALIHAGAQGGLRDAFKFVSYLTRVEDEIVMQELFKKRCPGHTPTWCTVVVARINVEGMHAEIAAEAFADLGSGGSGNGEKEE